MLFRNWHWKLATKLIICGTVFFGTNTAISPWSMGRAFGGAVVFAQEVVPDNTLPQNSVVDNLPNNVTNITGGTQAGGNLFHSFEKFGVPSAAEVHFQNAVDINNIINRVTGGNISNIDGLIKANGSANLFLINPAGIVFGENARLNIGGSFIGSTADSIKFADDIEFSATNPENTPLLTVNVPLGLQYGRNPGNISVTGTGAPERGSPELFVDPQTGLKVEPNKTLALIGGDVLLEGTTLKAQGGKIELGSVKEEGLVSIAPQENGFSFVFDQIENFGEIQLSQNTAVDATGEGAGDIRVTAKNLNVRGDSVIVSTQTGTEKSAGILINATESVNLNGINDTFVPSGLYANNVSKNPTESAGNITINTPQLIVGDRATITTNVWEAGDAGDININASNLRIENGGKVSAATNSSGNGGSLNIEAQDVEVIGTGNNGNTPSELSAIAGQGSSGNGGDLNIKTKRILIKDGAFVAANTFGEADAGNLVINAEDIQVIGFGGKNSENQDKPYSSGLFATAEPKSPEVPSTGNAGNLFINTQQMLVENGAIVSASTNSNGDAGELTINASDSLQVRNDGSQVIAGTSGAGNGGNLEIVTDTLRIENGAEVSNGASSTGDGGDLTIDAKTLEVIGMGKENTGFPSKLSVQTNAETDSTGNAGNLNINTQTLKIKDGAEVGAGTFGEGRGGKLTVNAVDIEISGTGNNGNTPSTLRSSASANSKGDAGEVKITTKRMVVDNGAFVGASTEGKGNGGNLIINADDLQIIGFGGENPKNDDKPYFSGLYASADPGSKRNAGNLTIDTKRMLVEGGAQVAAGTFSEGDAGNLTITASDVLELIGTGESNEFATGLFARSLENATGKAGIITLNAPSIRLDNKASINASTVNTNTQTEDPNTEQATININNAQNLILRRGSNIRANAEGENVQGGNININSGVIAALENSDITANSGKGRGGNIKIETQGIFGTQVREDNTPESDITATGANELLRGTVEINGIVQNPAEVLTELPSVPLESRFNDVCEASYGPDPSEFYIIGNGGVPLSPWDYLRDESIYVDWVPIPEVTRGEGDKVRGRQGDKVTRGRVLTQNRIVEATGWIVDENGDIQFVASVPNHTPSDSPINNPSCLIN